MNQVEKVATKSFNYFIEEGDGNVYKARALFAEWVEETSPLIPDSAKESWSTLVLAIHWCFQDAGYKP